MSEYIPFSSPLPFQKEDADGLCKLLEERGKGRRSRYILYTRQTGVGKDTAILPAALTKAIKQGVCERVIWLCPTDSGRPAKFRSLAKIFASRQQLDGMQVVTLASKDQLCPYAKEMKVSKDSIYSFTAWAESYTEDKEPICPYKFIGLEPLKRQRAVDRNLVKKEAGKNGRVCPYFLLRRTAESAQVVIGDYSVLSPFFGRAFEELFGKKYVLVIDEAHLLPDRIREWYTNALTERTVRLAINEATGGRIGKIREEKAAEILKAALKKIQTLRNDKAGEMKARERGYGERCAKLWFGNLEPLVKDAEYIQKRGEAVQEKLFSMGVGEESWIYRVGRFLVNLKRTKKYSAYLYSISEPAEQSKEEEEEKEKEKKKKGPGVTITYSSLYPFRAVHDRFQNAQAVVFYSATLHPDRLTKEMGLEDVKQFGGPLNIAKDVTKTVALDGVRLFDYRHRTNADFMKQRADEIATIVNEARNLGKIVAVSCTEDLYNRLKPHLPPMTWIPPGVRKEERNGVIERAIASRCFAYSPYSWAGVSIDHMTGGGMHPDVVIQIGLPAQKPTLYLEEAINYLTLKFAERGEEKPGAVARRVIFILPAVEAAQQSTGRAQRLRGDGTLPSVFKIFIDRRYVDSKYSHLLQDEGVVLTRGVDDAVDEMRRWFVK